MEPLLTEGDIAALLGTTTGRVRHMAKSDGLPYIDLPAVGRRFSARQVDAWVQNKATGQQKATNANND